MLVHGSGRGDCIGRSTEVLVLSSIEVPGCITPHHLQGIIQEAKKKTYPFHFSASHCWRMHRIAITTRSTL